MKRKLLAILVALVALAVPLAAPAAAAGPTTWTEAGGYPVLQHAAMVQMGGAGFWCSGKPLPVTIGFGSDLLWSNSEFPPVDYEYTARAWNDIPDASPERIVKDPPWTQTASAVDNVEVTYTLPPGYSTSLYEMSVTLFMYPPGAPYSSMSIGRSVLVIDCSNKTLLRDTLDAIATILLFVDNDDDIGIPAQVSLRLPRLPTEETVYVLAWGDRTTTSIHVPPRNRWQEAGTSGGPIWNSEQECLDAVAAAGGGTGAGYCEEFYEADYSNFTLTHDYPDMVGTYDPWTGSAQHTYSIYVAHYHPTDQPYIIDPARALTQHLC